MSAAKTIVEVTAVGLATPLGLDSASTRAAIGAGLSAAKRSDFINKDYERHTLQLIDEEPLGPLEAAAEHPGQSDLHRRALRIGGHALGEVLDGHPAPVPLLVALAPPGNGPRDPIGPTFLADLAAQAGVALDLEQSALFRQGGAGALYALAAGIALLEGGVPAVVVGGIDTFVDLRRLATLDAEERLHGNRTRQGFIAGEGAGFVLLRPKRDAKGVPAALAQVLSVGTGEEKGHRYSEETYRGDGLAAAFEQAFAPHPASLPKVQTVYAGFNGEELPAKEWGVARIRNVERFVEYPRIEHPADCIGDAGAGLAAIMLGLAVLERSEGTSLVWATSDHEARAAVLLKH